MMYRTVVRTVDGQTLASKYEELEPIEVAQFIQYHKDFKVTDGFVLVDADGAQNILNPDHIVSVTLQPYVNE